MPPKDYVATLIDEDGNNWYYETTIDEQDIFVKSGEAMPKVLEINEAYKIAERNAGDSDQYLVTKIDKSKQIFRI